MSATTIVRPAPTASPPRPPRGFRLLWVVGAVVAIGVVASVAFLTHYQPLSPGCCAGHSDTTYRQGAPFWWAVSLRNNGHLPITITGVDTDDGYALLRTRGIFVLRDIPSAAEGNYDPRTYEPFRPFT